MQKSMPLHCSVLYPLSFELQNPGHKRLLASPYTPVPYTPSQASRPLYTCDFNQGVPMILASYSQPLASCCMPATLGHLWYGPAYLPSSPADIGIQLNPFNAHVQHVPTPCCATHGVSGASACSSCARNACSLARRLRTRATASALPTIL